MENVGRRMVEIAEMVVPSITAKETYDRRESGESIVILHIRESDEWAKGYMEGAVLQQIFPIRLFSISMAREPGLF